MSGLIWTVVVALALFYGLALAALYWLQGRLVYPLEQIQALKNAALDDNTEAVRLRTEDGLDLTARYRAARDDSRPTVILFHGNGEDFTQRAHIALEMIEAGYGVLLAEYRGYAGNPGTSGEAGLYADARVAYAFVAARSAFIVLHGYSLGSGVATQLASEAHVDAPILIYGGTQDRVIPPAHFQRLYDAAHGDKHLALIEGANHIDVWMSGGRAHVMSFLAALIERALNIPR